MTPTSSRPERTASRALPTACGRPAEVGRETSTSVQPFRPCGHSISARLAERRGAVVVCRVWVGTVAAGPVVGTLSVVATVGSGAVSPTTVVLAALLASLVHQIAPAEAITATTRARSEGQTQSPGYQRRRRCQPLASAGTTPPPRTRSPHSRQYSWSGSTVAPQRGQVVSVGLASPVRRRLPPRRRRRARRQAPCLREPPASLPRASRSCCKTARRPEAARRNGRTRRPVAARPGGRSSGRSARPTGSARRIRSGGPELVAAREKRVDLVDAVVERGKRPASVGHELDAELVEPEHLVDDPAEVAHELLALTLEGATLALQRAGRGCAARSNRRAGTAEGPKPCHRRRI